MATPSAPLKIPMACWNSPTQKTYYSRGKISPHLVQKWNHWHFPAYFGVNLVAMATPCRPLKISKAFHFAKRTYNRIIHAEENSPALAHNWNGRNLGLLSPKFACHGNCCCSSEKSEWLVGIRRPRKSTIQYSNEKYSPYLVRNWNQCNWWSFSTNFVAMTSAVDTLVIHIAHLNSPTPIALLLTRKKSTYVVHNGNNCNCTYFCPCTFGCHGDSLCSLRNSHSIFHFARPQFYLVQK